MKYAFAGDRKISCNLLNFLILKGYKPSFLLVTKGKNSSHSEELKKIANLSSEYIYEGVEFKNNTCIQKLASLDLDYIIGVHFPYIIPKKVLNIPKIGFTNLHPSYLPYNKGWHTPSWAILDGTPYGATLHFMSDALDEGDIIHQKKIDISDFDTANTLYKKTLKLEEEVFKESIDDLLGLNPTRIKQKSDGTAHTKKDLENEREIPHTEKIYPFQLIDKLRALTTNKKSEAPYFSKNGKRIGININLFEIDEEEE